MAAQLHSTGYEILVLTYRPSAADRAAAQAFDRAQPYPVQRCLSRLAYWSNVAAISNAAAQHRAEILYSSTVYYGQAATRARIPIVCRSAGNDVLRPWIAWPFRFASSLLNAPIFERSLYPWLRNRNWPERLDAFLLESRQSVLRESAAAMSHISANSDFSCRALRDLGVAASRLECVPGGVDPTRFTPGASARDCLAWPKDAFVLFAACRLVEKKGLPLLLEAVAQLARQIPQLRLAIAGEGPERARLETQAASLQISDRLHWCGRLDSATLASAYRSADLFVFPSRTVRRHNGWLDAETMGRVLCEANASGLPVLAANTGGIPSVIRDGKNGILFAESDCAALCAAILRLYRDPLLRARLAREGRKRALRDFAWSRIVARQRSVIALVLMEGESSIITEKVDVTEPQALESD
jgi:glycosyltransferase involved in cell wall biosynthesis